MNGGQVIAIAKEWVETYASHFPGFQGAHLMGGINDIPKDAPFAAYRDVDMNIVLQGTAEFTVQDVAYKGLILEYGSSPIAAYQSAEAILANPELASNLAVNSILSDPSGMLNALHTTVAAEYPPPALGAGTL